SGRFSNSSAGKRVMRPRMSMPPRRAPLSRGLACQLCRLELDRDFRDRASEAEWHLIILIIHWRAGVQTHIKRLIPHEADGQPGRHGMTVEYYAIRLQGSGTALAQAWAIIFPVELKRVLAWCKCIVALPFDTLHVEQVPGEYGLAFE